MKPQLIFKKIDLAQTPPLMSALGQKQTWQPGGAMSALPPKADIGRRELNVCFVPKADILPPLVASDSPVRSGEICKSARAPSSLS